MSLSRTKRDYDGALGFHNYKTSDRLLTRFENDNMPLKMKKLSFKLNCLNWKLAVIPCNLYQQRARTA